MGESIKKIDNTIYITHVGALEDLYIDCPYQQILKLMKRGYSHNACKYDCAETLAAMLDGRTSINVFQILLLGKTGYGKSSLANRLSRQNVFEVNDVESCTRNIECALYHTSGDNYLGIVDFPGVGENSAVDEAYIKLYQEAIGRAAAIIYVLRADQRDWTIDLDVFNRLIHTAEQKKKVVIAVNCIDKVEPIDRLSAELSNLQINALDRKIDCISRDFHIDKTRIVGCSTQLECGISDLMRAALLPIIS